MKFLFPEIVFYLFILAWNTAVISGLVLLVATWICWISHKNGSVRLLLAASSKPLAHC